MKIEIRDPQDLRLHALHKKYIPEPPKPQIKNDATWNAFKDSVKESGVLQPLIITTDEFIMDGGWRWAAAKAMGLAEVPCIFRPEKDAPIILAETLIHRKQMVRTSAFYMMIPALGDYAKTASARRQANLIQNKISSKNPTFDRTELLGSDKNYITWANEYGFDEDSIATTFSAWNLLNDPDCTKLKFFYNKRGLKMPSIEELRDEQTRFREELEPKLYSGDKNVWNVLAAVGGTIEDFQKRETGVDQGTFKFYENLFQPMSEKAAHYHWGRLPDEQREQIATRWTEQARKWKPELRKAIVEAIEAA
jgi:hypothetical protein